jgi:glyoxylase-like metal-dependent hydrolase (beta-lactamase superfamily II)
MSNLKITNVCVTPADSAFLIDDGKTAVLCDAGFGFTGERLEKKLEQALGERPVDYILLTHSHYDHVLGAPFVIARYPNVKVVAGEYAAHIFAKDSAKAVMRDLDRKFAATCGAGDYPDLVDTLRVDIPVADGDTVRAGDMEFTAIALPGHTKCSVGFYLRSEKLLVSSETLGVYDGEQTIMPCYLVGYRMALQSIARVRALDIERMLFPHLGLADEAHTAYFLANAAHCAKESAEEIARILREGGTKEQALAYYRNKFYRGKIKEGYPIDAMLLNTTITVNLIERELVLPQEA